MTAAPEPPRVAGLTWRPASPDDADALAALFSAADEAEDLEEVLGPEGVRACLAFPGLDPGDDTLLALASDGSARAFGWVWVQNEAEGARAVLWVEAHPEHTGLEAFLLRWAEDRARRRLAGTPPGGRRRLRLHVEEHRQRRRGIVEAAGFRHARTFVEMHRPLTLALPLPPASPAGFELVPWSAGLDEATRLASNEAFSAHWDSLGFGSEQWAPRVSGASTFRSDLSFLALRGGAVAAFSLAAVDPEHNEREGVAEVWVERVGTRPAFRRQGLATTLLLGTLRAAAAGGLARAGLAVDEESTTRATALYDTLGFTTTRRTLAYVKDLD